MKKRHILLGLALAASAMFSLASCNVDENTDTTSTTVAETSTVSTAESTTTPGTVTPSTNTPSTTTPSTTTPSTATPSTATATDTPTPSETTAAISMNGTAYETIAQALAAVPTSGDTSTYTITLLPGTYNENGLAYNGSATIKISGATTTKYGADVIIKGHGSDMTTEKGRDLIEIQGTGNVILENLTLESDWYRADHSGDVQAEVLGTDTKGNTVAYNCSFKSHQDTLRTAGKAWFYGCYIEGDVDFIWMESAGTVALYEECEIVSVYDANATSHKSYLTAPRMAVSTKVGKGLVIYNSTVKESEDAKANGQMTYLARTPWSSGYYNQVAYINTTCSDVEVTANADDSKTSDTPWYGTQIATDYAKTIIGWKVDATTATSLGYAGNNDILDATTTTNEYGGRKAILNRVYDTGKSKYAKDVATNWDIDAVIAANNWTVTADASSDVLEGETVGESTVYTFDGTADVTAYTTTFTQDGTKTHFKGAANATITIPVSGKCYVEVYGYYSGTAEVKADTQNAGVAFFNNGNTNSEVEQDYVVYDAAATSVTITAKATTYITKIVVTPDTSIEEEKVTDITVTGSTENYKVGVALNLTATVTATTATNKSVKWVSSDETVGTVDPYTGKVTFVAAGNVTFTAVALDGSGVEGTIECTPEKAVWTEAEWYTTDTTVDSEDGAAEISNFSANSSAYKALGGTYTFTNLAGQTISTTDGLKLNSTGKLTIATTKPGTLTLVIANIGKTVAVPKVSDGTTTVTPSDTVVDADNKITTYTYALANAGTWNIERGDTSGENDPILYAKVVLDKVFDEDTVLDFSTGAAADTLANANITTSDLDYNNGNYTQIKSGTFSFKVNAGAVVTVTDFGGSYGDITVSTVSASGAETSVSTAGAGATITATEAMTITIGCGSTGYKYSYLKKITITYPVAISENTTITFGSDSNIDSVKGVTYTATITANGSNSQVKNGSITLSVNAGATVTVYGYGGTTGTGNGDYTSYTVTADGTTSETQTGDYSVTTTAAGDVVITAVDGNNYLMSISVVYAE